MSSEAISIGRFSQITRLTQKALRLYDERGLLVPSIKDPMTGYRYYSLNQIEEGFKIKFLVSVGFDLGEIAKLLESVVSNDRDTINILFSRRLTGVQQDIERLKRIEALLLGKTSIEGLFMSTSEPMVKEITPVRVISKREIGTYGVTINKLIGEIMGQIFHPRNQKERVAIVGPPMYICHDKSFKEVDNDIEMVVPITGRISVDPEFEVKNLSGGKVIFAIHTGPYQTINETYNKIFEFAVKNKCEIQGLTRELYITNPREKPENELITEVQLPVA
jgi:effector-binding domain-containing protein